MSAHPAPLFSESWVRSSGRVGGAGGCGGGRGGAERALPFRGRESSDTADSALLQLDGQQRLIHGWLREDGVEVGFGGWGVGGGKAGQQGKARPGFHTPQGAPCRRHIDTPDSVAAMRIRHELGTSEEAEVDVRDRERERARESTARGGSCESSMQFSTRPASAEPTFMGTWQPSSDSALLFRMSQQVSLWPAY
ncbi:zinc finger protein basonuclin-2 [Arapaima gigas]